MFMILVEHKCLLQYNLSPEKSLYAVPNQISSSIFEYQRILYGQHLTKIYLTQSDFKLVRGLTNDRNFLHQSTSQTHQKMYPATYVIFLIYKGLLNVHLENVCVHLQARAKG